MRFIDHTIQSNIRANRSGGSGRHSDAAVFADVDNDGDLDVFTSVYVHRNYDCPPALGTNDLLLNDGNARFTLAPNSTFHTEPIHNTASAVFLDYDNDGNIDLFIGNWYKDDVLTLDRLYKGNGDGSFIDVTDTAGINAAETCVYGVAAFDWNNDGFTDLFSPPYSHLAPGSVPIHWMNNGNGTFTQVQESTNYDEYRGYGSGKSSFGSMPCDFDNDGDIDFLEILTHGDTSVHSTVVINDGGVFDWDFNRVIGREREDPNPHHHGDHYGSWFDFDNDGLSDFILTECGYGNNRIYLFRQRRDNVFEPVTLQSGLNIINDRDLPVHNVIPLDYDLDGDQDLLIGFASQTQGVQLWRNDIGNNNNWLTIILEGEGGSGWSNKSAIGARVELTVEGETYTREVYAGNGQFGPQVPLMLHFGLGRATIVDEVKVYWPRQDGRSRPTVLTDVDVNQFLRIREASRISGPIWDGNGGPLYPGTYIVAGDLTVPKGKTLTIKAGAELYFESDYKIIVNGVLEANGTKETPVLLLSAEEHHGMKLYGKLKLQNRGYLTPGEWR
jgi:hypothetical protein